MKPKRILILDTETGGLDPSIDPCVEVACILYDLERAEVIASYASLIRAEKNDAEHVNHIPLALLADAPEASEVWPHVEALAARADVIVAHRADFDRSFVSEKLKGAAWACSKFWIEWPRGRIGDDLVHLALAHGVGVMHAHRAMTDCDTLARLFTRAREMGTDLGALLERAMRPRVRVVAIVSYDDRQKAREQGFAWDAARRQWWREMPTDEIGKLPFETRREPDP
jgi:DNA polymerase III subunit epsilon